MQRRAAGLVVVLLALIGMLIFNAAAGRSVAGVATPVPPPAAPGAGSCLFATNTGWVDVACAKPHTAEVVQSWAASAGSHRSRYAVCTAAGQAYLGNQWGQAGDSPTQTGWLLPAVMSSTVLVSGPGTSVVPGWSWQACVVRPILLGAASAGYRGRLHDVPATGVLPVELRPCFNRPGPVTMVGISCAAPHTGEVLAERRLQIFGNTDATDTTSTSPAVQQDCLGIARRTTAAVDPTFGGKLEVVVILSATGLGYVVSDDPSGNATQSYVLYDASCTLQAAGGHALSASIVGLGAGPLPLE